MENKNTLETKIKNLSDEKKLEFLEELLVTDEVFKQKFVEYFSLQEKVKTTYKTKDLKNISQKIFKVFDSVDVEIYVDDIRCNHSGYYGYYEESIADELCEDLFLEIEKEIAQCLKQKDFYQIFFLLLATSKAIDLEPDIEDNFGLIYDYDDMLREYFSFLVNKYSDNLKETDLTIEYKKELVYLLLDNSSSKDELKRFEVLFDELINSEEIAKMLISRVLDFHIEIQLRILDLLKDDKLYIKTAKNFYKKDYNIAIKLLKKLSVKSIYDEYELIAKECFEKSPSYFISEIFDVIKYDKSPQFYLELLKYKVLNENNLKNYITYKKYLNEKELISLQNTISRNHNQDYYIKILEYEKKYDDILKLAKSGEYNISKVLKPIKNIFPKECFEIIIKKCNKLLNSVDRNRETYIEICDLLKLMIDIDIVKNEINLYIKTQLINRKPRLPALKDELMKAGLL